MSWLITLIDMITNLKRQEFKYYITDKDVIFLRENLSKFMQIDRNSNKNNEYKITTVYFDSLMSNSLNEKLDGINYREKFRIRMYEDDTSSLKFDSPLQSFKPYISHLIQESIFFKMINFSS